MRKTFLILVLIAISSCQDIVVNKWEHSDNPIEKVFKGQNWESAQEFAVYGWFKIDSALAKNQWANILVFTRLEDFFMSNQANSRVFSFVLGQGVFELVSFGSDYRQNVVKMLKFAEADKDKWAFFHFSYSFSAKKMNFYIKLATTVINETYTIDHLPSSFYKLILGGGFTQFPKFSGSFRNININNRPGSYREKEYDGLLLQTNPDFDGKQCPIFFSECNYKGNAISLCEKKQVSFENMKSIRMPPNYGVKIPHPTDPTKKVVFNTSVDCITSFNWTTLSEKDISYKKKHHLKRNN